jgi:Uma2 family endonuclease
MSVLNLLRSNPDANGERLSKRGEPTWEIAQFLPKQGEWTEEEYFQIEEANYVELVDGCLEFLPTPTPLHQRIAIFLFQLLQSFLHQHRVPGEPLLAPCPIRLWPLNAREPDVFYLKPGRLIDPRQAPDGADLVMEVVSEGADNRKRDLIDKRHDYAKAGIAEYWIIDPETERISVLTLDGDQYRVHGEFVAGQQADSALLPGFVADVAAVFAAGKQGSSQSEPVTG